ncbi:hypothetical protein RFI_32016, partial [Reticulomyxa filosa]
FDHFSKILSFFNQNDYFVRDKKRMFKILHFNLCFQLFYQLSSSITYRIFFLNIALICANMQFFNFVFVYICYTIYIENSKQIQDQLKKLMKWWHQREQNDKSDIIEKFKIMSKYKWKDKITKEDIDSIRFTIDAYLYLLTAYVMMDKNKKLIKMKELTFEEIFRQTHNFLEWKDLQKMKNENTKFELFNMKNNMIESDETVRKNFENAEPSFQLLWTPEIIGKTKTIKNALMDLKSRHKLHKNKKNYDALIMIISGHGDDGDKISINEIREFFGCRQINL